MIKILRRLTLRYQQLKLCDSTLILRKNIHDIKMSVHVHTNIRKICGIKPAEHTIKNAYDTNNPADHIDPAAYEISPAVTGINPADLRWAEHNPFSSLETCPHVWF